jgi:hypothetical protein
MHKRSFLMSACGAALSTAATAAPATGAAAPASGHQPRAPRRGLPALGVAPNRAEWARYLHEPFLLQAQGLTVAAVLDRLEDGPACSKSTQFVLGFRSAVPLLSGLYELAHASGQTLPISLTANAAAGHADTHLRAEFNLLPTVA